MSEFREPVLSRSARITGIVVGAVTLAAGGVAVFRTDNALGSTALVAAGVVIAALAVFGNHLRAVEVAGIRLQLTEEALRAQEQAAQARAVGDLDRAEALEHQAERLLAAATSAASRYERLRTTEPPGWDRTSRMEGALRQARALDAETLEPRHVADLFATGSDGNRVVALALVQERPRLATVDILVEAIEHSRSPFEQYQALVAAEQAAPELSAPDRERLRTALESVVTGPLGERSSDRRTVARRLLQQLSR